MHVQTLWWKPFEYTIIIHNITIYIIIKDKQVASIGIYMYIPQWLMNGTI